MPRPKYQQDDETAKEKLIKAFWDSIEEAPYHKLTVLGISARAGLNRNSFYYHYESMDDLAVKAVEETLMRDLPGILVSQFNLGEGDAVDSLLADRSMRERFDRVCLLAGKNSSPELQEMLKTAIADNWKGFLSIDMETFSYEGRLVLEFCLGGVFSLLGLKADAEATPPIRDMFSTDFGKTVMGAIIRLAGE